MSRMLCSGSSVIVNYFQRTCIQQMPEYYVLTLKTPITTAADDNFFSAKTSLDISCESSADDSHEI